MSQLLKHDKSVKITPLVVRAAITFKFGAESFIRTLFEHDPTLEITQADLMYLMWRPDWLYEEGRKVFYVLIEHGKTVEFTADFWRRLSERFQSSKEMKELFYRLNRRPIEFVLEYRSNGNALRVNLAKSYPIRRWIRQIVNPETGLEEVLQE